MFYLLFTIICPYPVMNSVL